MSDDVVASYFIVFTLTIILVCPSLLQLMNTVLKSHALGPSLLNKELLQAESRNLLTEIVVNYMLVHMERLVILCVLAVDLTVFICYLSIRAIHL